MSLQEVKTQKTHGEESPVNTEVSEDWSEAAASQGARGPPAPGGGEEGCCPGMCGGSMDAPTGVLILNFWTPELGE